MQALLRIIPRRAQFLAYPSLLSRNLSNMADATPQNTQKDPVTGDMVSKKCALLYPFTTNFLMHLGLFLSTVSLRSVKRPEREKPRKLLPLPQSLR